MNKEDAIRIFNQPHDRFNMDLAALRAVVLDLIERVNKLETPEKPKRTKK